MSRESESGEMGWPDGPIFEFVTPEIKAELSARNPRWRIRWEFGNCLHDEREVKTIRIDLGWDGTHDQHFSYVSWPMEGSCPHDYEVKRIAAQMCIDAMNPMVSEVQYDWCCGCKQAYYPGADR